MPLRDIVARSPTVRSRHVTFLLLYLARTFVHVVCALLMAKRARSRVFAMRVYTREERDLKRIATAAGFDTAADYLRDHIERQREALDNAPNADATATASLQRAA